MPCTFISFLLILRDVSPQHGELLDFRVNVRFKILHGFIAILISLRFFLVLRFLFDQSGVSVGFQLLCLEGQDFVVFFTTFS